MAIFMKGSKTCCTWISWKCHFLVLGSRKCHCWFGCKICWYGVKMFDMRSNFGNFYIIGHFFGHFFTIFWQFWPSDEIKWGLYLCLVVTLMGYLFSGYRIYKFLFAIILRAPFSDNFEKNMIIHATFSESF